jgi:hypothetical protein
MVQVAERDTAPATITASLNYLLDEGEVPFTYTGGPGSTEIKSGGKPDPRDVTIANGRLEAGRFSLERNGFRFIRHDTSVADFYDPDEIRRV